MNGLLKNVMIDARKKMEGEEVSELLFFIILKMMEYHDIARAEGLFGFEEACIKDCNIPEFEKIFVIQLGAQIIADGNTEEYVTEVLTAKYWANDPQGIYAMANYIVIRAFIALVYEYENVRSWYKMQELLTAYLPDGYEKEYESYKLEHFPQFVIKEQTPKEEFMESKPFEFSEKDGYIATVRDKLENAIMDMPVNTLKQVIENVIDEWQLPVVLKSIPNEAREKIFSCMAEEKAQELSHDAYYRPPMLMSDVKDALTYFLFEIIEYKRNGGSIWKDY